ncbi:mycothiol synthase [Leucobacter celer]|uniref:mycothiol synthase n=1 Tax=Leucobacter celer TaxID=668625 RepID=UPI0006A7E89C|nr:mycothiol synthase [Leucobacter celer]
MTERLAVHEATEDRAFESARELIAAAEAADGRSPVSDQALLAAAQGQRALLLFAEQGGARDPSAVGIIGQGEVDLVVHPDERGRGIGAAALGILLARGAGSESSELRAWAHGDNPAADALLKRAGFEPVRSLYRMALDPALLPIGGPDPLALPVPPGLRLRAFDPERPGDPAAWVRANAAAFAAHPEQGRITEADFALMRQEEWFDAGDLILLAEEPGDELAGSTWIKTVRSESGEPEECELYAVGVRPEYAGRGLGGLLLDVTLARMAQHGPTRVTLYVDGENERAVRMYEHASFTIDSRSRQWSRPALSAVDARMDP